MDAQKRLHIYTKSLAHTQSLSICKELHVIILPFFFFITYFSFYIKGELMKNENNATRCSVKWASLITTSGIGVAP